MTYYLERSVLNANGTGMDLGEQEAEKDPHTIETEDGNDAWAEMEIPPSEPTDGEETTDGRLRQY